MNMLHAFALCLALMSSSVCIAKEISSTIKENPSENSLIIRQTLQELNETIFSNRALHVELLKNCQEAIPLLAEWIYEDWHSYDASLTKEKLVEGFKKRLNDDRL